MKSDFNKILGIVAAGAAAYVVYREFADEKPNQKTQEKTESKPKRDPRFIKGTPQAKEWMAQLRQKAKKAKKKIHSTTENVTETAKDIIQFWEW